MYLEKIKDIDKKDFFKNCPYNFTLKDSKYIFNCKNCKDPKCIAACPNNAIYFSSKGIVSIDQSKCNGCKKCVEACPNNAIVIKRNKAYKCDLCTNSLFSMFCYNNNPGYLKLIYKQDIDEIRNKYLGYFLLKNKGVKYFNNIFKFENELIYFIDIKNLSFQEIELINFIFEKYIQKNENLENIDILKFKTDLENILIDFCYFNKIELDSDQFEYILEISFLNLYNYGPISRIFEDDSIEEISIIDIDKPVYIYHRSFGWIKTNLIYTSKKILTDLINKLSWNQNKYITLKNPLLNSTIKNNSRMNAIISPITDSVSITIRKFFKKPFTIKDLVNNNTINIDVLSFLFLLFLTDSNLLVVGNTGSGKTTTLNCLLSFIKNSERFVIVEDVREIDILKEHKVFLKTNNEIDITLDKLIINTLRMRPDRVVIGEIRDKKESRYLIESMLSGQAKGTYTTYHSQSGIDAINRLKSYGVMDCDLLVLDFILVQKRYNSYNKDKNTDIRQITELSEVVYKDNKIFLNKIYEYDLDKKKIIYKNFSETLFKKIKFSSNIKTKKEFFKIKNKIKKNIQKIIKSEIDLKNIYEDIMDGVFN